MFGIKLRHRSLPPQAERQKEGEAFEECDGTE